VINTEFRGAAGYGREFMDKGNKAWGTEMHTDLVDIAAWAIDQGIAPEKKIGIWGWSYGGYATFAGLAFAPKVWACGISMFGVSDLEEFGHQDNADSGLWLNRTGNIKIPKDLEMLRAYSPINAVKKIKSPLLVTHGSKDNVSYQIQSDKMVDELLDKNKRVSYFIYPNEPHDYRKAESWVSFWAVAEQFFSRSSRWRSRPDC